MFIVAFCKVEDEALFGKLNIIKNYKNLKENKFCYIMAGIIVYLDASSFYLVFYQSDNFIVSSLLLSSLIASSRNKNIYQTYQ